MTSNSLTRRTILVVLLVELLCAIAFSMIALVHERNIRFRAFDVMLQGRSDSLLGAVQDAEDPDDNVTVDPTELRVSRDDVYAMYNLDGRQLGHSVWAPAALIQREGDGFRDTTIGRRRYRIYERHAMRVIDRVENGGVGLQRPIVILYAAPTGHIWHEIFEAASFYGVVSVVLLLLTTLIMVVMLRRVLMPINELAAEAANVSMTSLHFQTPSSALHLRELRPLAEALTTTIGGLRLAFEKQHRFVSDAAHELKTAVAVVRSTIQLLMMKSRTREEYAEGLDRLLKDNARVEELVSQMLLLARLEEKQPVHSVAEDIAFSTRKAAENLQTFAEQRSVALAVEVANDVRVCMPAEQAEILVSNLIVNAVQHSPGESRVRVSLTRNGNSAVLCVADQGSGISPGALEHVFERFYREDASRSRETGGAGLGLAICKSIVDSAGGSIAIESAPNQGTKVLATFRMA